MDDLKLLALIEIGVSLLMSVAILFFVFTILRRRVMQKNAMKENNVAFALFAGGTLLGISYLLSGVATPIIQTIRIISGQGVKGLALFFEVFKYSGLFLVIGLLIAGVINAITVFLFTALTKNLDEFAELRKNNIAVGILTAVITLSIAIILKDSVVMLMESFVPYPERPNLIQ